MSIATDIIAFPSLLRYKKKMNPISYGDALLTGSPVPRARETRLQCWTHHRWTLRNTDKSVLHPYRKTLYMSPRQVRLYCYQCRRRLSISAFQIERYWRLELQNLRKLFPQIASQIDESASRKLNFWNWIQGLTSLAKAGRWQNGVWNLILIYNEAA